MLCSPSRVFVDVSLWLSPGISVPVLESYKNVSEGDSYDCLLTSVPCESKIIEESVTTNETLILWFDTIVVYTFLTVIVITGVLGNIINVVIFSTNDIAADSTNNLLLGLAVSDLLNVTGILMVNISVFFCFLDDRIAINAINLLFTYALPAERWFNTLSLDIVTIIAVQRAVAVMFPFKVSTIFSNRNIKIMIAFLFLLCIATLSPFFTGVIPRWIDHPYFDKKVSLGFFWVVDFDFIISFITLYSTCRSVFDFVIIAICVSLTIIKLKQQAKNRSNLTSSSDDSAPKKSKRETKAIKMSLAVCFISLSVCAMGIIVNTVVKFYSGVLFTTPLWSVTEYGFLLLNAIYTSFNFFLYMKMSDKYREVFINAFKSCFKRKSKA